MTHARPAAGTGLWPKKPGEDASTSTYFLVEPRVGYWMTKGETREEGG